MGEVEFPVNKQFLNVPGYTPAPDLYEELPMITQFVTRPLVMRNTRRHQFTRNS